MKHALASIVAVFGVSTSAGFAIAQDVPLPTRIFDRSLEPIAAHPLEINASEVIAGAARAEESARLPRTEVLAVVVGPRNSRETDSRWRDVLRRSRERSGRRRAELRMVDGQVLSGHLLTSNGSNAWHHTRLGSIPINLEETAAIRFVDGVTLPAASDLDVVVLRNGDRITGFIEAFTDPLMVEQEEETKAISIPLERVAAMAMVNPAVAGSGTRLWTADGSIFDVEEVLVGEDGYVRAIRPRVNPTREVEFRLRQLRGISFDPARLLPLAGFVSMIDVETNRAVRPWAPPARTGSGFWPLNAPTIELSGPIRVRWTLPERGCIVATTAELPIDSIHGDFELIVRDGEREVARHRLNQSHPEVRLRVELQSDTLELELGLGQNGPVHDDLLLHEALVLLPSSRPKGS